MITIGGLVVSARGRTEIALWDMFLSSPRTDLFITPGRFVPSARKDTSMLVTFCDSEILIFSSDHRNDLQ